MSAPFITSLSPPPTKPAEPPAAGRIVRICLLNTNKKSGHETHFPVAVRSRRNSFRPITRTKFPAEFHRRMLRLACVSSHVHMMNDLISSAMTQQPDRSGTNPPVSETWEYHAGSIN
jgi:hypothetical protein